MLSPPQGYSAHFPFDLPLPLPFSAAPLQNGLRPPLLLLLPPPLPLCSTTGLAGLYRRLSSVPTVTLLTPSPSPPVLPSSRRAGGRGGVGDRPCAFASCLPEGAAPPPAPPTAFAALAFAFASFFLWRLLQLLVFATTAPASPAPAAAGRPLPELTELLDRLLSRSSAGAKGAA